MDNKNIFIRINKRVDENLYINFKKIIETKKDSDLYILLDSRGGELKFAFKIANLIAKYKNNTFGIAYRNVDSSAIPIFLSAKVRCGHKNSTSLLHRAKEVTKEYLTKSSLRAEKAAFQQISEKLNVPLEEIYDMANKNTVISMDHHLGKKFFLGI